MARKNSNGRGYPKNKVGQPKGRGDGDFLAGGTAGFNGGPITKTNVRKPPTAGPKGIGAG